MAIGGGSGDWIMRLLAEDFSASCKEDRFCVPCAAAFCHHCCAAHHRGQGHQVVVRAEGSQQAEGGEAEPGAAQGHSGSRVKDSFCVSCGAGFSAALCSHHSGHDTFRIDVFDGRYCARCTGSEPWFHAVFDGIDTYKDEEKGHILVPLHPRRRRVDRCPQGHVLVPLHPPRRCVDRCSLRAQGRSGAWIRQLLAEDFSASCKEEGRSGSWISQLLAEDFSASCKEDRFCVPCAAAFCHHCCGAHHRGQGHDVVVRAEGTQQAEGEAEPGAAQGHYSGSRGRDSFCVSCSTGFSAALCSHHSDHDTFRIDVFDGLYCARCTGSEPWFHMFDNIRKFYDEKGHILVPLHPRSRCGERN